jgi:hypothetical protein
MSYVCWDVGSTLNAQWLCITFPCVRLLVDVAVKKTSRVREWFMSARNDGGWHCLPRDGYVVPSRLRQCVCVCRRLCAGAPRPSIVQQERSEDSKAVGALRERAHDQALVDAEHGVEVSCRRQWLPTDGSVCVVSVAASVRVCDLCAVAMSRMRKRC